MSVRRMIGSSDGENKLRIYDPLFPDLSFGIVQKRFELEIER